MDTQITPQQAKTARAKAQLSQGRVATEVGINRSYLSQFESGKLLLDDATLNRLRDYYVKHGVKLEPAGYTPSSEWDDGAQDEGKPRLRDGFYYRKMRTKSVSTYCLMSTLRIGIA